MPEAKYIVWGLTAAEVEMDVLTGENCVRRVDLYEDAGQSLSPWVDVGQIEGAFTMGMGLYLTEQFRLDPKTGKRITNRAWVGIPEGQGGDGGDGETTLTMFHLSVAPSWYSAGPTVRCSETGSTYVKAWDRFPGKLRRLKGMFLLYNGF